MGKNAQDRSPAKEAAHAVGAAHGALKTGKALAKGALSGPHGVLAAGLWETKDTVLKLFAAIGILFLIPVLYILMLPSLVFGNDGLDRVPDNVLNNDDIILENIQETESAIEDILRQKHDRVIEKILKEGDSLGMDCEYEIVDEFVDEIIFESTLIISQFCAFQDDFREISLEKLSRLLDSGTDQIFHYTVETSEYEKVINEETGETKTITLYTYTLEYEGSSYYAGHVFFLDDRQLQLAEDYASNLHLYLGDALFEVAVNEDLVPGETGNAAVDIALTKLGTPYSQARRNQSGYFDCSSFTHWVYAQLGINLSYGGSDTAASQGRYIMANNLAVSYDSLAPGDLVFYSTKTNRRYMNITHVAIYCGDGYVVDASFGRQKVVYRPIYNVDKIVLCGRPYG